MRKKRLTPYSGSLFRLALTMVGAVSIIAVVFVAAERTAPLRRSTSSYDAPAARADARLSRADGRFLVRATELNADEIRFSELAAQQAVNDDVRQFAGEVRAGHRQTDAGLQAMAERKGVALAPRDFDPRAAKKLGDRAGRDFDEAYLEKMTEADRDTIDLFEQAALQCDDPELKAFAAGLLPALKAQRERAQQLKKASG